jgi:hypothetical protein
MVFENVAAPRESKAEVEPEAEPEQIEATAAVVDVSTYSLEAKIRVGNAEPVICWCADRRHHGVLNAAYDGQTLVDITYLKKAGKPPMIIRAVATGKESPFKTDRLSPEERVRFDEMLRGLRHGAGSPASCVAA